MVGDAHDLAVGQVGGFKQPADAFMPKVMETEIVDARAHGYPSKTFADGRAIELHVKHAVLTLHFKSRHFCENRQ